MSLSDLITLPISLDLKEYLTCSEWGAIYPVSKMFAKTFIPKHFIQKGEKDMYCYCGHVLGTVCDGSKPTKSYKYRLGDSDCVDALGMSVVTQAIERELFCSIQCAYAKLIPTVGWRDYYIIESVRKRTFKYNKFDNEYNLKLMGMKTIALSLGHMIITQVESQDLIPVYQCRIKHLPSDHLPKIVYLP